MKIATLTYQRHDNYGAMLQCYALQKKIEETGVEAEVIDYICEVSGNPYGLTALKAKGIKRYITGIIGAITRLPRIKSFEKFRKLIKMSKTVTKNDISQLGACYDGYIVGSDNVWNSDITGLDENYFLSFVADNRKKTSFAASFGNSKIKDEHRTRYKKLLSDFTILTSREETGANLIRDLTGKEAEAVCDPSLLLTLEEWDALAIDTPEKEPYLLAYQMVPSRTFVNFVKKVAKKKSLKVIYIPFPYSFIECKIKLRIGPLEWLGLFKKAEYVITDSFHGCVFSVIFKKQFVVRISQLGERIENLLETLTLKNRIVTNPDEVFIQENIDYSKIEPFLELYRERSEKKLNEIIEYFSTLSSNGIVDPSQCTGCFLCKNICNEDAISIKTDDLGFKYPQINKNLCTSCNNCGSICSLIARQRQVDTQSFYSAINKNINIVKKSGSGGVFHALAASFINSGGVVYGAAYQDGFIISHDVAKNYNEIARLMGTKYVQSSIKNVYLSVTLNLKNRIPVLFVGTPCQCAAIKTYILQKNIGLDIFYSCDLFCHGVLSPEIWSRYISYLEKKYKESIKYVSFRDKSKGWRNKFLKITTETQDISDYCNNKASILRIYEQDIAFRESCYQCKYMNMERCGDMSIGDFWGIERLKPKLDNNTGISAVIINSDKGKILFESINTEMKIIEFKNDEIIQQVLKEPTKKNLNRRQFIEDYYYKNMEYVLKKYSQVTGKLYLKRNFIIPFLYKTHIMGAISKILYLKNK